MARKMFKGAKNAFTPADDLLVKFPSVVMFAIVAVNITVSWKKKTQPRSACSLMSDGEVYGHLSHNTSYIFILFYHSVDSFSGLIKVSVFISSNRFKVVRLSRFF